MKGHHREADWNRPGVKGVVVQGKLENFSPSELIQIIGLLGKSGALRLQHVGEEGLIAFRAGKIIFAASPSVRESLGSLLLARGLITETQLAEALVQQAAAAEKTRLGTILVELGVLDQATLEDLIRGQFSTVISEFFQWNAGTFAFEVMELVDRGEVELEAADFLAKSGVESTHILLEAARRADERQHDEDPASDRPDTLDDLLEQTASPTIRGEIVYQLLELGSGICRRCLMFAVHPKQFRVIGRLGLDQGKAALANRASNLEVPREAESILARAVAQQHSILARLPETEADSTILDFLGGPSESKSVAFPLSIGGQAILVLYGDNLPQDLGTGQLDEVEIAASNVLHQGNAGDWGT